MVQSVGAETRLWGFQFQLLISCVALGRLLNLSGPQSPLLQGKHVRAHTISESCREHHVCLSVKCLDPCLEPEKVLYDVSTTVSLSILT